MTRKCNLQLTVVALEKRDTLLNTTFVNVVRGLYSLVALDNFYPAMKGRMTDTLVSLNMIGMRYAPADLPKEWVEGRSDTACRGRCMCTGWVAHYLMVGMTQFGTADRQYLRA